MRIITFITVFQASIAISAELKISNNDKSKTLKTAEVLKLPIQKITLENDPEYKKKMTYQAVPFSELLKLGIYNNEQFVQLIANDGYVSTFEISRLINYSEAKPYLAIENPSKPWPNFENRNKGAGPFFLIWVESKNSDVSLMEWPYSVVSIKFFNDLKKAYPAIFPKENSNKIIMQGFEVFKTNCFSCHKINAQGPSDNGPDLNRPMSPVEYFKMEALKKYIRNPRSMREWAHSHMPMFPEKDVSDAQLEDLLQYFKSMAENRK